MMLDALKPPTPAQIAAYKAELARGGLTPDDLDPNTKHRKLLHARVVNPTPTFERPNVPTNWGSDIERSPGMAPGTRQTRTLQRT
jgi:hypothetical protein